MPEPYWPKKKGSYTLADAEKSAKLVRIRCYYCKIERYFHPRELRTLFGNIEVDDVIYRQRWHCTNCKNSGTLEINVDDPPAEKRQSITIRRLERIEIIRKPIWRDERGG
jgi:hypothetical protein